MIYFVRHALPNSPVKIGYTEDMKRLAARMRSFRNASPWGCTAMAAANGGRALERELHQAFAASRMEGEWFQETPELLALIGWVRVNPDAAPLEVAAMGRELAPKPPRERNKTTPHQWLAAQPGQTPYPGPRRRRRRA